MSYEIRQHYPNVPAYCVECSLEYTYDYVFYVRDAGILCKYCFYYIYVPWLKGNE